MYRAGRGIASCRTSGQWPVTGKFHGDSYRQVLAGCRPTPCSTPAVGTAFPEPSVQRLELTLSRRMRLTASEHCNFNFP
jgi:hypothetical protein